MMKSRCACATPAARIQHLTMLGAGLLWMGWYGFNVGSIVFAGEEGADFDARFFSETGRTFANTTLAAMAAILGWLLIEYLLHRKATSLGAASGMVAGLAVTLFYMVGSRFYGMSWFGTATVASGVFGLPLGFIVIWVVSRRRPARRIPLG